MCTDNPGNSVISERRIVPECDMSISEDTISNLVILVNPCKSFQSGRIGFTPILPDW
jgi:hypothetical protein